MKNPSRDGQNKERDIVSPKNAILSLLTDQYRQTGTGGLSARLHTSPLQERIWIPQI